MSTGSSRHYLLKGASVIFGLWLAIALGRAAHGAPLSGQMVYLPLVDNGAPPLLLGIYPAGYPGSPTTIARLQALDAWAGQKHSLVGWFSDLEDPNPAYNVPTSLEALWQAGYTPVVNLNIGTLGTPRTAADLANGLLDTAITAWVQAFATWAAQGNGRLAWLAPLPEMNIRQGNSYGGDPLAFRAAFAHLQAIFAAQGVAHTAVRWVFAPNGWTAPGDPPLADYYPGAQRVDLVGISAYNWGYCPAAAWYHWDQPGTAFASLDTLRAVAPGKPLLIMQTASTAYRAAGRQQPSAKNAWLLEAYTFLSSQNDLAGVLYFNMDKECDWAIYNENVQYTAYPQAATLPRIGYQSPAEIAYRFP